MNTINRKTEIMIILIIRRHTTARKLADELGVTTRTIQRDIQALSPGFSVYTKQGGDGGIGTWGICEAAMRTRQKLAAFIFM